jgi:hypothetical protein
VTFPDASRSADLDEEEDEPILQRVVSAGTEAPPLTRAPISIFAIKKVLKVCKQRRKTRGDIVRIEPTLVVEKSPGVQRVVGRGYPSDRWTQEKQTREEHRRARQTQPKPTRKAKTKSKKLRELIGDDDSDT